MSILYLKFKSVNSDIIYNTFEELSENSIIQENDAGWDFKQLVGALESDAKAAIQYYYTPWNQTPPVNSYFKFTFVNDSDAVEVRNLIEAETTWNVVEIEIISESDFNTVIDGNELTDLPSFV